MVTTRRSRALAWIGAIPHWFYPPALRIDRPLWEAVIVWTSAVGCLIAVTACCSARRSFGGGGQSAHNRAFRTSDGSAGTTSPASSSDS